MHLWFEIALIVALALIYAGLLELRASAAAIARELHVLNGNKKEYPT